MTSTVQRPTRASRRRRTSARTIAITYGALAVLAATAGARPTGIGAVDAALLAGGAVAAAACGRRARTIPIYVAAALAMAVQPEVLPLALAGLAVVVAFSRRRWKSTSLPGMIAGGLTFSASVGAPFSSSPRFAAVPLIALVWVALSARSHGGRRFQRRFDRIAEGLVVAAVTATALSAIAVLSAKGELERGRSLLEQGLREGRAGNTEGAIEDLAAAARSLRRGESTLGAVWALPAWGVPGVSQNARALHAITRDVADLASASVERAREADLEDLRARSGQIDLRALADIEAPLRSVLGDLQRTRRRFEAVADGWLLPPVRDRLDDLVDEVEAAIPSAELALEGTRVAPGLLGGDGTKTYLVLFTTPVEGRAGGFPGNFAEITFTDGRFEKTRFGRIAELEAGGVPSAERVVEVGEDFRRRYERFGATQQWRSLTLSPDFPTVARVAAQLYPQSGGREVDGVLTLDPVALGGLLSFTGPIAVPGLDTPLTAATAAEFLLRDQYLTLPDNPARIDLLESLSEATFDRLTTADLPGPRSVAKVLGPMVAEGHIRLFAFDDASEPFLDDLGITGALPSLGADALTITTNNAIGGKVDLFLQRNVDYDVEWDPATRTVRSVLRIHLVNSAPSSGLPDYVIGNALRQADAPPRGTNRTYLSVFTPLGLEASTLDGEPLSIEAQTEQGRRVYSTFLDLGPEGGEATVELVLTGVLPGTGPYRLETSPQVMVNPDLLHLRVRQGERVLLDRPERPMARRESFQT